MMSNTGNKFNDLYELSKKIQPIKDQLDKTKADHEYERVKDDCTFKPNILKSEESN